MKNQVISVLKSVAVVVAGVLVANYIQEKFMSAKVMLPTSAPIAE